MGVAPRLPSSDTAKERVAIGSSLGGYTRMLYADTDGLHGSPEGSSGTRSSTYIQADPDGTAISVKAIADCTVEGGYVLSSGGAYVPTEVEKQRFAAGETIIPRVSGSTGVEFLAYLIVR